VSGRIWIALCMSCAAFVAASPTLKTGDQQPYRIALQRFGGKASVEPPHPAELMRIISAVTKGSLIDLGAY
jgi:hypothetical protein